MTTTTRAITTMPVDPDFGEYLAELAGDGVELDAPVPIRPIQDDDEETNFPADETY